MEGYTPTYRKYDDFLVWQMKEHCPRIPLEDITRIAQKEFPGVPFSDLEMDPSGDLLFLRRLSHLRRDT